MNVMVSTDRLGGEVHKRANVEWFGDAGEVRLGGLGKEISSMKDAVYEAHLEPYEFGMGKACDAYNPSRMIAYSDPVTLANIRGGALLGVLDPAETIRPPKPKAQELKRAVQASATVRRRSPHPPQELYPDLDFEYIHARIDELRGTSSDSEAVSLILGRSVQIVHQPE